MPRADARAAALGRVRGALFWELLWYWMPKYLDAVADLGTGHSGRVPSGPAPCSSARQPSEPAVIDWPAALRDAPPPLEQDHRGTVAGLGAEASRWSARQARRPTLDAATQWWVRRSAHSAAALAPNH